MFGDSFAAGTRLPHEQTWTSQLQALRPDLEVVNFGVDGYGGVVQLPLALDRVLAGESPYADWPAFDVVAQAMSGLVATTGEPGTTPHVGPAGTAVATGLSAATVSLPAGGCATPAGRNHSYTAATATIAFLAPVRALSRS